MREILGKDLDLAIMELGIGATKTYQGEDYDVWEMSEDEFQKLTVIPEEDWKDEYGFWRSAEGSNIGNEMSNFKINNQIILAWDGDCRIEALNEVNGNEKDVDYCYRDREYRTLLEYFCDEIGASQPRNVCALAVDLAKINGITMSELFVKYEG
jgi:hypothetical protein